MPNPAFASHESRPVHCQLHASGSAEGFEPAVGRPPSLASVRTLTHGGELVIARVPLLARCGGVVCLLA